MNATEGQPLPFLRRVDFEAYHAIFHASLPNFPEPNDEFGGKSYWKRVV